MPVYERRYFLSLLTKEARERQEHHDEMMEKAQSKNSTGKGNRTTRVSGDALKSRMKSGDLPLT